MNSMYYEKDGKKYMVLCDTDKLIALKEELKEKNECPYLEFLLTRVLNYDYSAITDIFNPNIFMEDAELRTSVHNMEDNINNSANVKDKLYYAWELEHVLSNALRYEDNHPAMKYYLRAQHLIHLEMVYTMVLK